MTPATIILISLLSLIRQAFSQPAEAEIVFAGDAMMHKAQIDAARCPGGTYDFSDYFSGGIDSIVSAADYAVVNFECPAGGKPHSGYPCFCAPDEYASTLSAAGFDMLLLANNHILDRRDRGLHRTISLLDSLGIPHAGVYHDAAARDTLSPTITDIGGFKVAFLNYTYGTNGIEIQGNAVVDYIDRDRIAGDVQAARGRGAEIIAACVHWGDEYKLLPNASQRALADYLTTLGVDMIIGGHPHVIQPMEMRDNPVTGGKTFLVYSLGNFISNMKTADTRGGAIVKVKLRRDSLGQAQVAGAQWRLVFTEPPEAGSNFRLVPSERSADRHARTFERNATAIYERHNQGVERWID